MFNFYEMDPWYRQQKVIQSSYKVFRDYLVCFILIFLFLLSLLPLSMHNSLDGMIKSLDRWSYISILFYVIQRVYSNQFIRNELFRNC